MFSIEFCIFNIFSLQETYEQKRSEHLAELQKKEEEMRQMFVVRVKEKETELKDAEKDVRILFILECCSSSLWGSTCRGVNIQPI